MVDLPDVNMAYASVMVAIYIDDHECMRSDVRDAAHAESFVSRKK